MIKSSYNVLLKLYDELTEKNIELEDTVDALSSELDMAIETAYNRGAEEWVRLNYPEKFKSLSNSKYPFNPLDTTT